MTTTQTQELNDAIADRPDWTRPSGETGLMCPTAQRHSDVNRWGFDDGPWASVIGASDGWGWVVWDVDTHKHDRFDGGGLLATPGEAMDAADAALDRCLAARQAVTR